MKEKRIFRYVLADAWKNMISQVDVIELPEGGTVRCIDYDEKECLTYGANTKADFFATAISCEEIDKIEKVMYDHKNIFAFKEVEFPVILDGVINTFEFVSDKNFANVIKAYNIWAIKEETDVAFFEMLRLSDKGSAIPYKGKEIVIVYDKISKILMENGVSERYLKLH